MGQRFGAELSDFYVKEKLEQLDKPKDKSKTTVQEKHTISNANRQIPPKGPHKEDRVI